MYVRWKKRVRFWHGKSAGHYLTAVLVESKRIDGKPRQRTISYLGSIDEVLTTSHLWRTRFWKSATAHLNFLALDSVLRARVETALENKIAKPTPESAAQFEALRSVHKTTPFVRVL